eukprot:jgi/Bigna1/86342/estExt_fgenesh1_pg.C_90341
MCISRSLCIRVLKASEVLLFVFVVTTLSAFLLTQKSVQGLFVYLQLLSVVWPQCDFQNPNQPYIFPQLDSILPYQAKTFPGLPNARFVSLDGHAGALNGWIISPGSSDIESASYPPATSTSNAPLLSPAAKAVLYFHGNGCNRASYHHVEKYRLLASMGFHVFAFDYRGFGDSEGWPDEEGLLEDAETMLQFVTGQGFHLNETMFWGHSLGGAVAIQLASKISTTYASGVEQAVGIDNNNGKDDVQRYPSSSSPSPSPSLSLSPSPSSPSSPRSHHQQPHSIVLESTFTSLPDLIWQKYIPLPFEVFLSPKSLEQLLKHRFRSLKQIKSTRSPMLILHGKEDGIIPHTHGAALADAAANQRGPAWNDPSCSSFDVGQSELSSSPSSSLHSNPNKTCKSEKIYTEFLSVDGAGHNTVVERAWEAVRSAISHLAAQKHDSL